MAGKQYAVVRQFRRVDPESGDVTWHEVGDLYSGPMEDDDHYLGNAGPDDKGPLLTADPSAVQNATKAKASASNDPSPTSDSSKGK